MRVLLAIPDAARAEACRLALESNPGWDAELVWDGRAALRALQSGAYELAALHLCLPGLDGLGVLSRLRENPPICPHRTLLLCERELIRSAKLRADCVAPLLTRPSQLAALLGVLAKKKLPLLSRGTEERRRALIARLLDDIGMQADRKGRRYAEWLLFRLAVQASPERIQAEYDACGLAMATSAANVERCLRHAVERCFTTGRLTALEALFGATVDAERGKLTNRAFLLAMAERVRAALECGR